MNRPTFSLVAWEAVWQGETHTPALFAVTKEPFSSVLLAAWKRLWTACVCWVSGSWKWKSFLSMRSRKVSTLSSFEKMTTCSLPNGSSLNGKTNGAPENCRKAVLTTHLNSYPSEFCVLTTAALNSNTYHFKMPNLNMSSKSNPDVHPDTSRHTLIFHDLSLTSKRMEIWKRHFW